MDSIDDLKEVTNDLNNLHIDKEDSKEESKYELSLYYDDKVRQHCNNDEEIEIRCSIVYTRLEEDQILASKNLKQNSFELISIENLSKIHTMSHIEKIMSCEKYDEDEISQLFAEDTYECKFTPECARLAAGSALEGMKDVVSSASPVKSAFCLIRPPGHHALESDANGFCFFNNAGVAAHFAKELFGLNRVCILDWDVHHGDGTQDLFYKTEEVLFISVHRHENGKFFPYK